MKKIYLAAPYSHESHIIVAARVDTINQDAAKLMQYGHLVFSPISHSHYIAVENDLPKGFEFWQAMNHSFIDWSDAVYVLQLKGWEESNGIKDEIKYAEKHNKEIVFIRV